MNFLKLYEFVDVLFITVRVEREVDKQSYANIIIRCHPRTGFTGFRISVGSGILNAGKATLHRIRVGPIETRMGHEH